MKESFSSYYLKGDHRPGSTQQFRPPKTPNSSHELHSHELFLVRRSFPHHAIMDDFISLVEAREPRVDIPLHAHPTHLIAFLSSPLTFPATSSTRYSSLSPFQPQSPHQLLSYAAVTKAKLAKPRPPNSMAMVTTSSTPTAGAR